MRAPYCSKPRPSAPRRKETAIFSSSEGVDPIDARRALARLGGAFLRERAVFVVERVDFFLLALFFRFFAIVSPFSNGTAPAGC
jgi:hypothetical protein